MKADKVLDRMAWFWLVAVWAFGVWAVAHFWV